MSLIQAALEKAGQETEEAKASSQGIATKPRPKDLKTNKKPTLPTEPKQEPVVIHQISSVKKKETPKKSDSQRKANIAVWGFIIAIAVIAIASIFLLGSEIITSWNRPAEVTKASMPEVIEVTSKASSTQTNSPASIASESVPEIPSLKDHPFRLNGITSTGGERLALVNNQIVGEGDKVAESVFVTEINKKTVLLKYYGQELTLTL